MPLISTYTPQTAINLVTKFVHGVPLAGVEANICDVINSYIWTYYPWSWTISSLTPINCVDGVQDYSPANTDILRFLKVRLARTDTTPNEIRELAMLADLSVELSRKGGLETNTAFGYFASTNILRLMWAASVGTGQTLQIQGEYQKAPTKITDSTMNNVLVIPDQYFLTFVEGLKYLVYQLSDDQRAGTVQMSKNGTFQQVFTGQLAIFMHQLNYAARTEDLSRGDQFQFPESSLGMGRALWPGLYGLS